MVICGRNMSNCGGCMDVEDAANRGGRNSAAPLDSNGYLTQKASMDIKELAKN